MHTMPLMRLRPHRYLHTKEYAMSWVENILAHLSQQGHRVTEPRRAILERIVRYSQPFTTEQLFKDLGGEQSSIGRATVYRTVDLLLADRWLARVHWSPAKESAA